MREAASKPGAAPFSVLFLNFLYGYYPNSQEYLTKRIKQGGAVVYSHTLGEDEKFLSDNKAAFELDNVRMALHMHIRENPEQRTPAVRAAIEKMATCDDVKQIGFLIGEQGPSEGIEVRKTQVYIAPADAKRALGWPRI
jgi:hypothetical protein